MKMENRSFKSRASSVLSSYLIHSYSILQNKAGRERKKKKGQNEDRGIESGKEINLGHIASPEDVSVIYLAGSSLGTLWLSHTQLPIKQGSNTCDHDSKSK